MKPTLLQIPPMYVEAFYEFLDDLKRIEDFGSVSLTIHKHEGIVSRFELARSKSVKPSVVHHE